ncbi:MAG: hypothetical protein HYS18_17250 [Burkholderiales bacterium]|nr:hypothetical protein [Burkholderiales bacterium]
MTQLTLSRPLDAGERFFWLLDRVSGMNFVVFAEISGTLDEMRLRDGLRKAQEMHPLLRAKICANPHGELRFEPDGETLDLEIIAVAENNWQAPIEKELCYRFELTEAPLMRCLYLRFTDGSRSVLALTFHHTIADGRSGTALLREILHEVFDIGREKQADRGRIHPAMHDAFPEKHQWHRQPEAFMALAETRKQELKRHGRPAALPWLNQQQTRREPRFIRIELDAPALVARCKQHGATVHGALGAAQLTAQFKAMGECAPQTLSFGSPADMRPYLDGGISATGLGLYVSLLFATYRVGEIPFWELARAIGSDIKKQLTRGDGHLLFTQIQPEMFPPTEEGIAAFAKLMLASPQSTMISNIGVVEPIQGTSAVEAISFVLCPMPYQVLFTAVSTYRDRLIVNLAYDAAKLSPAHASSLAAWIRQALQEDLS